MFPASPGSFYKGDHFLKNVRKDMLHDFGDVLRGIKTDVNKNAMKFAIGFKDTMFTSVIMIMDAEYESVFNFLAGVLEPLLKRQADEFTTDL